MKILSDRIEEKFINFFNEVTIMIGEITYPELRTIMRAKKIKLKKEVNSLYRLDMKLCDNLIEKRISLKLSDYKLMKIMKEKNIKNYHELSNHFNLNFIPYTNRNGAKWTLSRRDKQLKKNKRNIEIGDIKNMITRAYSKDALNSMKDIRLLLVTNNNIKICGEVLFKRILKENNITIYLLLRELNIHFKYCPSIGRNEKRILDELEMSLSKEILRGYYVKGSFSFYYVDGYIPEDNIVLEVDEEHHFSKGKLLQQDIIRQKDIQNILNCSFVRIPDKGGLKWL